MVDGVKKTTGKKQVVRKKTTQVKTSKQKNSIKEVDVKIDAQPQVKDAVFSADMFFTYYVKGWKDCFKLKGRTSRFELWVFMLVNSLIMALIQLKCCYIFSDKFLVDANASGLNIEQIDDRIFWAEVAFYSSFFIPLMPIASMMIRRMHDIGKLAWNGYLEPVAKGFVVLSLLSYVDGLLIDVEYYNVQLIMNVFYVTILYSVGYYSLKFLFTTMFYDGDKNDNQYGIAQFKNEFYKTYALKFSVFYFLFTGTMLLFYIALYLL